jgi:hypothetical protein
MIHGCSVSVKPAPPYPHIDLGWRYQTTGLNETNWNAKNAIMHLGAPFSNTKRDQGAL